MRLATGLASVFLSVPAILDERGPFLIWWGGILAGAALGIAGIRHLRAARRGKRTS